MVDGVDGDYADHLNDDEDAKDTLCVFPASPDTILILQVLASIQSFSLQLQ